MVKDIINELKNNLVLQTNYEINQKVVDEVIDYCAKNHDLETGFRLALSTDYDKSLDYSKLYEYYISVKDDFYFGEIVCVLEPSTAELNKYYKMILDTKDEDFISEVRHYIQRLYVLNSKEEIDAFFGI